METLKATPPAAITIPAHFRVTMPNYELCEGVLLQVPGGDPGAGGRSKGHGTGYIYTAPVGGFFQPPAFRGFIDLHGEWSGKWCSERGRYECRYYEAFGRWEGIPGRGPAGGLARVR